ncbi:MAG: hypothetical protein K2K20_08095 [Lachnospiraceae bacterium]|nr:hypothetical protein [Lachnospiraceae bacterium]
MKKDLKVTLTGFTFAEDGNLPEDFEVYLIVQKDGRLSAGCWDTGLDSCKDGQPGCFRQSRGGIIRIDEVLAWLPIESEKIDIGAL